jgi:hypothetical protein
MEPVGQEAQKTVTSRDSSHVGSVTFDPDFLVVSGLCKAMLLGPDFFFLTRASIDFSSNTL